MLAYAALTLLPLICPRTLGDGGIFRGGTSHTPNNQHHQYNLYPLPYLALQGFACGASWAFVCAVMEGEDDVQGWTVAPRRTRLARMSSLSRLCSKSQTTLNPSTPILPCSACDAGAPCICDRQDGLACSHIWKGRSPWPQSQSSTTSTAVR